MTVKIYLCCDNPDCDLCYGSWIVLAGNPKVRELNERLSRLTDGSIMTIDERKDCIFSYMEVIITKVRRMRNRVQKGLEISQADLERLGIVLSQLRHNVERYESERLSQLDE